MPKAEWGVKRTCPSCEARFYDLQRQPIVCPACGATFAIETHGKVSAPRERRAPVPVAAEALVEDEELVDDAAEDEEADEPLLADDDEDEDEAGPALAEEDPEEEGTVAFKGPDLIDGDDIDAEVDEAEDEEDDDIEELDDLPDDDDRKGT